MRVLRVAIVAVINVVTTVLALICAAAAVGAHFGRFSAAWDILAHFAPLWLVGASLSGFASLVFGGPRRRAMAALSAVGLIAAAGLMIPEFLRDTGPKASADAPGQLKIIQFNVWSDGRATETNLGWLLRQDADIIVLEETYWELRQTLLHTPGWHVTCENCETLILSRKAPVATGPLVDYFTPAPIARATFRDARGEFTVVGTHHSWPTEIDLQQAQEGQLADFLTLSPKSRTIVAGDFNSASWAFSRRRWDATFDLIRRDRAVASWPARPYKTQRWMGAFPFLPIDHVYAGEDWATVSVRRGPRLGSDHYPLIVTLAPVPRR